MLFVLRWIYIFLIYLFQPFAFLRLLWRSRNNPAYRKRWNERLGFFKMDPKFQNGLWIHAVSVGEVNVATPLIKAIQKIKPELPIVVTTMTITGSAQLKKALGDSVFHGYLPYDLPCALSRFLNKARPRLCVIMETEVWPNLLFALKKRAIPAVLANGRLSEKSAKGYQRFGQLAKAVFEKFSLVMAQSEADAKRYELVGAVPENIKVTGSIKFDIKISSEILEAGRLLREQLGQDRLVWIAASTREGEEKLILSAYQKIKAAEPRALLLLVPRHPERFSTAEKLCADEKLKVVKRSDDIACDASVDVFLGDTMGELLCYYAAADVVFVGGSLLPLGGQNILEPAAIGLPVITGPHLYNFSQAKALLEQANALTIVQNEAELAEAVLRLMQSPDYRKEMGEHARRVIENNRGALDRQLQLILNYFMDL